MNTEGDMNGRVGQIGKHIDEWDNGLYASGIINEVAINFLIDTGSTVSLISHEVYINISPIDSDLVHNPTLCNYQSSASPYILDPELPQNEGSIQNVNGTDLRTHGCVDLEMLIADTLFHHQFIICDITPNAILGQDFLLRHVKKIDYQQQLLQTDNTDIKCWIGGKFQMVCRVQSMNTVVIPSNSISTLLVKIPSVEHISDIAIVEPTNHIYTEKNISVVRGIINTRDETKLVQIVNYSNSDVKLYPNTLLGTC